MKTRALRLLLKLLCSSDDSLHVRGSHVTPDAMSLFFFSFFLKSELRLLLLLFLVFFF